ncbi:hypothetical protein [Mycobacterium sp. EPa45]|uniref:hypothetical protein n=1 Tax=Mycobacterium sp. EPa45 TaxID=1545728 RepID=UPI0006426423|nr:hypothetical protein [Mycobacterium sp. EPa45]AKK27835.1 hypothetical protein AB431_15380 [Mycobacterium sp. EPa45]
MTRPQVWVSATSPDIDFDGATPGSHWQLVGEIDSMQESAFFTYIQVFIVGRRTVKGPPEFYLDGDRDSEWVQQAKAQPPFWVAIDPWGQMRASIHGAHPTYLVSKAKAKVTSLVRRPPEPHPGRTDRPIKVPIKLTRVDREVFTRWRQPGT